MTESVVYDEVSVVLIGNFNPAIFHPSWFSRYELLPVSEADAATIEVCSPQITRFSLPWFSFEVIEGRFVIKCSDESHYAPLRDLVAGAFRLLSHTPISKFGINRQFHFDVLSDENWHHVGHVLAPKAIWDGLLESPGMQQLAMEGKRPDAHPGSININVQPIPNAQHRVAVVVNSHFDVDCEEGMSVVDLLMENWESTLQQSKDLATTLIKKALASQVEPLGVNK